jgi:putative membrane protein
MSDGPAPRQPRVFAPDDPSLVIEAPPPPQSEQVRPLGVEGNASPLTPATAPIVRPTLSDLSDRGFRWGALLLSAITGAVALGLATWFYRLVSLALERQDWIGWTMTGLLGLAGFAFAMILLREIVGFSRLARLNRLRSDVTHAMATRDLKGERRAVLRLAQLYTGRPATSWALSRFRDHARDVHDPGDLLRLADRDILASIDAEARQIVTRSAKRVATVTTLSPFVAIAMGFVLVENLRLLRLLATLYGGRPGWLSVARLARMVAGHMIATGGLALTDDLLGQFLGQDILRRLSRRLGEGAFNGALTARVGVAAIEVIRPLPFIAARQPRVRDILGDVLKPIVSGTPSEASSAEERRKQ